MFAPRLQNVDRFMRQAQARGDLPPDLDPVFLGSLIAGPLLFHLALAQIAPARAHLQDLPERLVDAVLEGVRRRG